VSNKLVLQLFCLDYFVASHFMTSFPVHNKRIFWPLPRWELGNTFWHVPLLVRPNRTESRFWVVPRRSGQWRWDASEWRTLRCL